MWTAAWWRKVLTVILIIVLLFLAAADGIAEWYIHKHANQPLTLGTTFIADYAESFGLDPHQTFTAILSDLQVKQVRLVGYWNEVEPTPGHYDFSELDWEFAQANKYGVHVSLALGMRQPRWPECHVPNWVDVAGTPESVWEPQLYGFMHTVVNRYKNNPALSSYELENEFFMKIFGQCQNFDRNRLVAEFNMVKSWDPHHTLIVSRSNNWIGIPLGQPRPDEFGVSVYKRVWDATFTHRYFEYPLPAKFYSALAGAGELLTGKDIIIHELQAEPWTPTGMDIHTAPLAEQYKSMNAARLTSRINYAESTGIRTIDLWGAEWWYWLMVDKKDPSVWNAAKQAIAQANQHNQQLAAKNQK